MVGNTYGFYPWNKINNPKSIITLETPMQKPYLVIYHANCLDGFTAAWVARNKLGESNCDFHSASYGQEPPPVAGYNFVFILDFSYKYAVMRKMAEDNPNTKFKILDHHKTAEADLKEFSFGLLSNVLCIFDMERSGCRIAWDYFNVGKEVPYIISRVEDRDLWRFKFMDTRDYNACLFSYEYDFKIWDDLAETPSNFLCDAGTAIERKHFKDIKELLKITQRPATIKGHTVPVANLPYTMSSDAGHIMTTDTELDAATKFAACYWDVPDGIVFSLRSNPIGMDVSEIAKHFGGGGHKHAAGFKLTVKEYVDAVKKGDLLLYPDSPDAEFSNGRT